MAEIVVSSEDFDQNGTIPLACAAGSSGGGDESPQLSFENVPPMARSLAVTCWDPDAPTTVGFSHWVRFDMPPTTTGLPHGSKEEAGPWIDGINDMGGHGYTGMAPPPGDAPHQYQFTVYALDVESLGADEQTTYAKFRFLAREHVISTGTLVGTFGAPPAV